MCILNECFFCFLVSTVIGIPTVKRPAQSYLIATLSDLIEKMNNRDKEDTLIVIFIAEVKYFSVPSPNFNRIFFDELLSCR